jgi:hypothetical protein
MPGVLGDTTLIMKKEVDDVIVLQQQKLQHLKKIYQ